MPDNDERPGKMPKHLQEYLDSHAVEDRDNAVRLLVSVLVERDKALAEVAKLRSATVGPAGDAELGRKLVALLTDVAGDSGVDEGAVECLERVLQEREFFIRAVLKHKVTQAVIDKAFNIARRHLGWHG